MPGVLSEMFGMNVFTIYQYKLMHVHVFVYSHMCIYVQVYTCMTCIVYIHTYMYMYEDLAICIYSN